MAERRKKLFDLLAVAGGTGNFLVSKDQDLEFLVALHTVVFKDRHLIVSSQAHDFRTIYNGIACLSSRFTRLGVVISEPFTD